MQQWNVYPASSKWSAGTAIQFVRFLLEDEKPSVPEANDSLAVEFPDNGRAEGAVISSTETEIIVRTSGSDWALQLVGAPTMNSDGQLTLNYLIK